jgi:threonyl-tRNA synthetase
MVQKLISWQISTIQLDFLQPSRFKLEYTAEDASKKTPVMIHRALVGSPDRFLGILIEHYAGAFPTWLAPEQVRIVPVSDKHFEYGSGILAALKKAGIRASLDQGNDSMGKKIRNAKVEKVPYVIVIGDKEMEDNTITVESRDEGKFEPVPLANFISKLESMILTRT